MKRQSKSRARSKAVRYGVIGLGYIAQIAVLPAFRHAKRNSELAALVSDDPRKLATLPQPSGAEGHADVRIIEALERSIDTDKPVALETPRRRLRRPTLEQALRRPPVGKPQLVHASASH
jgi:predicted dehydrogenase